MPRNPHRVEPIERFPAKPRRDGRFQKRVNGVLHYFGRDGDRRQALREYDAVKHQLYAGLSASKPVKGNYAAAAVKDLSNRYLLDIKGDVKTYAQYKRYLMHLCKYFGGNRGWHTLTPDDWTRYGKHLRSGFAATSYNRRRAVIVAMFNHADEQGWIERPPRYGRGFRRIPLGSIRSTAKARLLTREDINAILGRCSPQLFAMVLLGLNGGFGAADCAALTWDAIDLDSGFIRYARVKNAIPRGVPLWRETIIALRRLRHRRPNDVRVFRTRTGRAWDETDIAHEFRRAVSRCEMDLPAGVGLGACRHTFATYANEVRDTDARRHIMGRKLPALDDIYVESMFVQRLTVVTEHVRSRLAIADLVGDAFNT